MSSFYKVIFAALVAGALSFHGSSAYAAKAAESMQKAEQYLQQLNYKAAIIELKNALQAEPKNVDARIMLGDVYLSVGQHLAAEKELTRARDLGAKSNRWSILLGRAWIRLGRPKDVLSELKLDSSFSDAEKSSLQVLYGQAYGQLRKVDKAQESFEAAIKTDSENAEAYLGLSEAQFFDKKLDASMATVEQALEIDPRYADAWVQKATLLVYQKDMSAALAALDRAIAEDPKNFRALTTRANIYVAQQEFDKARVDVKQLLAHHPLLPQTNFFHALLSFQDKQYAVAEEAVQKVLAILPEHERSLKLLGVILMLKGENNQAARTIERYLAKRPDDLRMVKSLADVKIKTKDFKGVIGLLEDAKNKWPEDADILAVLGRVYIETGEPEKGQKILEKAARMAPDSAAIKNKLAYSLLQQGDAEKAIEELQSGDGQSVQSQMLLVMSYAKAGENDKAILLADQLIADSPDQAMLYNLRGSVNVSAGNVDKAKADFVKATTLSPDYVGAHLALAQLYYSQKDYEQSTKEFTRVLELDDKNSLAMIGRAQLAYTQNRKDEGFVWMNKAHQLNPLALVPALHLVSHYLEQREAVNALSIARNLEKEYPKNPDVLLAYGQALLENKETVSAANIFERMIEASPETAKGYFLLAKSRVLNEKNDEALDAVQRGLKMVPDSQMLHVLHVELLTSAGRTDDALSEARVIQKKYKKDTSGYLLEARIFMKQGAAEKALPAYRNAIERQDSADIRLQYARALKQANGAESSLPPLKEWLEKHDDAKNVRFAYALALHEAKQANEAIKQYEMLLDEKAPNFIVLNNLAWLYMETNPQKAVTFAKQAYDLKSKVPTVMDTYGWALLAANNAAAAVPVLKEASALAPTNAEIGYHYAKALSVVGEKKAALSEVKRALANEQAFAERKDAQALLESLQK